MSIPNRESGVTCDKPKLRYHGRASQFVDHQSSILGQRIVLLINMCHDLRIKIPEPRFTNPAGRITTRKYSITNVKQKKTRIGDHKKPYCEEPTLEITSHKSNHESGITRMHIARSKNDESLITIPDKNHESLNPKPRTLLTNCQKKN